MKTLIILCMAAVGFTGLTPEADASEAVPVNTLPSVARINETVVIETGHRHRHHRRYRWVRHRRHRHGHWVYVRERVWY